MLVISYLSIFENFWNQLELYQKLKQHDKMQHEFINIGYLQNFLASPLAVPDLDCIFLRTL